MIKSLTLILQSKVLLVELLSDETSIVANIVQEDNLLFMPKSKNATAELRYKLNSPIPLANYL